MKEKKDKKSESKKQKKKKVGEKKILPLEENNYYHLNAFTTNASNQSIHRNCSLLDQSTTRSRRVDNNFVRHYQFSFLFFLFSFSKEKFSQKFNPRLKTKTKTKGEKKKTNKNWGQFFGVFFVGTPPFFAFFNFCEKKKKNYVEHHHKREDGLEPICRGWRSPYQNFKITREWRLGLGVASVSSWRGLNFCSKSKILFV